MAAKDDPSAMTAPAPYALNAESVHTLVHSFYRDVRADPDIGPIFDGAIGDHWDLHLARLVDFWSTVMLGTRSFQGNVFGKHMALDGVRPEHFSIWLGLWKKHTEQLFAPDVAHELQHVAHGIARNLFRGFFGAFPEALAAEDTA